MAAETPHDLGGAFMTQQQIRDWLMKKVADMLKCPPEEIGVEESFASLGLESLSLFTLTGDLAAWLGYDLSATLLLKYSTIDELAGHLAQSGGGGELGEPPSRPADGCPLPVSLAQERLLKHAALPPARDANLLSPRYQLKGELHVEAFHRALTEMVRRHEILRTTFHRLDDGTFAQVVHAPETAVLDVVDWSAETETLSEDQMKARVDERVMQPVDLGELPLFSTLLIKMAEDEHRVVFLFHHLIYDGGSLSVFYQDLGRLYSAFRQGFLPALEPLDWQYADFAIWERNWLRRDGAAYQERLKWWTGYWSGAPERPRFAFERAAPLESASPRLATAWTVSLDDDTSAGVSFLARECHATAYAVHFAAFAWHLLSQAMTRDMVIGTYVSDRKRVAAGQLVGMFTSMMPMRVRLPTGITFRKWVGLTQEHLDAATLHRELPFEELAEHLEKEGLAVPRVHTLFQQVEPHRARFQLDEIRCVPWSLPGPKRLDAVLSVSMVREANQRMRVSVAFNEDRYDARGVQEFLAAFVKSVGVLVHAPDEVLESHFVHLGYSLDALFGPG